MLIAISPLPLSRVNFNRPASKINLPVVLHDESFTIFHFSESCAAPKGGGLERFGLVKKVVNFILDAVEPIKLPFA